MLSAWLSGAETPASFFPILVLALLLDALLGDPRRLYRALPHPVALIGCLISAGERQLNDPNEAGQARSLHGTLLVLVIVGFTALCGWMLINFLDPLPGGWLVLAVLASTLIAFRGLFDHATAVASGLKQSLAEGRAAVAHIVGRNPESLDEAGVARAAVESIAENFSDGVVAPVFWYLLLGLPGLAAYKAINTLDSMIGHRSDRYLAFGRAAAKLDDGVNWLPARLAGALVVVAAALVPNAGCAAAWRTMLRDAPKHRSPNAGWQEAAFAGALGFALAGPRRYGAEIVDDHWMGDGRRNLEAADIRAALRLYLAAGALLGAGVVALWAVI